MNREKTFDITVAGHICLDIIPRFQSEEKQDVASLFVPGKLITMKEVVVSSGGPVSNTGLNAKKLGMKVAFMGKVGDDFFGRGLLSLLKDYDADKGMIIAKGEHTSYTVVLAPAGIDRMFLHSPGANNTYSSADIDYEVVKNSRLFHLGYPPLMQALYRNEGKELTAIFKKVKQLGVTTSLDMSLPDPNSEAGKVNWEKILENTLPYVDIFLPSVEESAFMIEQKRFYEIKQQASHKDAVDFYTIEDVEHLARRFLQMGTAMVVLKCAHRGSHLRTAGKERLSSITAISPEKLIPWTNLCLWGEAYQAPVFGSATGSGDSFIAGFLTALLSGYDPFTSLRFAHCVGCQNVTRPDAISGVTNHQETLRLMETYSHLPVQISSPGWKRHASGLWKKTSHE